MGSTHREPRPWSSVRACVAWEKTVAIAYLAPPVSTTPGGAHTPCHPQGARHRGHTGERASVGADPAPRSQRPGPCVRAEGGVVTYGT